VPGNWGKAKGVALISKTNPWKIMVILVGLVLLVAIFYAEEDWRGKRAWEKCKRELEARGETLDWNDFIPPPVPDDQNFFKAPKMAEWFVKPPPDSDYTNKFGARFRFDEFSRQYTNACTVTMADVTVLSSSNNIAADSNMADIELRTTPSPAVRKRLAELLKNALGANAIGSQGPVLLVQSPSQVRPVRIVYRSESLPPDTEIIKLFTELFPNGSGRLGSPRIWVESAGTNTFRAMTDAAAVGDYLAWSDQFESDFDLIREALKRPYARMDGDYSLFFTIPIPNFVAVRAVNQTLAQRAQCYLLLSQPGKALKELTLLNDTCRLLENAPTGKTMTLVAAMINVAVAGLYVETIADGFRLHAWQEPQLTTLQTQLEKINPMPFLVEALKTETAGMCSWCETIWTNKFLASVSRNLSPIPVPQGWIYKNMVNIVELDRIPLEGFAFAHDTISPRVFDDAARNYDNFFKRKSPYKFLALISVPNISKAVQTTAHNQTLANEGQIACALERYRLAQGEYPENLDALVPQFIGKLPHDIIGGQPLHYRRTEGGKFLLYSVGWNETDDGGQVGLKPDGSEDREKGDWVWSR
jgi:hypothetical protein